MIAIQVARIVASFIVFLDLTDEADLNLNSAVQMMEEITGDLQALDKAFLRELVDAFPIVAEEYSGEAKARVLDIPYSYYLEEELAEGDPVRLAELEAIRDARE
jgi:hypothetical protein